jgi:hypothetical protein
LFNTYGANNPFKNSEQAVIAAPSGPDEVFTGMWCKMGVFFFFGPSYKCTTVVTVQEKNVRARAEGALPNEGDL